jgi:hypothetical protein
MSSPSQTARILHLALMASLVLSSVVLSLVPLAPSLPSPLFLYAVFAIAAVFFAGALVISTRLPREGSAQRDAWWSQNLPRALVIWSMIEGPSMLGAVAFMLTRDFTALIIPGVGLLLFVILGPNRLEQG